MANIVSIAPALGNERQKQLEVNYIEQDFMESSKDIRRVIYSAMNVVPESTEVSPTGQNAEVDKRVLQYLKYYKRMTRSNVSI